MSIAEMSSDAASKLWDDNINRRLFELTHSQNVVEAFGGLLAIGAAIQALAEIQNLRSFDRSQKNSLILTKKRP